MGEGVVLEMRELERWSAGSDGWLLVPWFGAQTFFYIELQVFEKWNNMMKVVF